MITIGLTDQQLYFRKGISTALSVEKDIKMIWEVSTVKDLVLMLNRSLPSILLVSTEVKQFDVFSFMEQKKLRYPTLKVILLTPSEDQPQVRELLEEGVNAILSKETEQDNIASAIRAVAEKDVYFNELVSRVLLTRVRRKNLGRPADTIRLSKNEIQVLELLADGLKTQEIANRIFLSEKSVENIRYHLKIKTGVSSSISLVAYALRNRLIR